MSGAVTLHGATGLFQLPIEFGLASGEVLRSGQLAFELFGAPDAPVVLVLGGISAGRHVASSASGHGWWDDIVRPGGAIDVERYRVLGVDFLAGVGASSGPENHDQDPFPAVTSSDQARALALLLDHLRVDRLHALVGASYGGMVGLAFASAHCDRLERLVAICAADRPHPLATAWRSVQRAILALGTRAGLEHDGVALARALAMATYRGADELLTRFDDVPCFEAGRWVFPIERYLAARGADFTRRMTSRAYAGLSLAIDRHTVDPSSVTTATTLVAASSDQIVPVAQVRHLASRLAGPCRLEVIDTPFGHDAFLKDIEPLGRVIREALER